MNYLTEDLAGVYEKLLNENDAKPMFHVNVNQNLNTQGFPIEVILYPQRMPPKNEKLQYETVQLVADMFVRTSDEEETFDLMDYLANRILGVKRGEFESNRITYRYACFLDFGSPSSQPVVNQGEYYAVFRLEGTVFITAADGPYMANDATTYFSLGDPIDMETSFGTPVPMSADEIEHKVVADALPIGNDYTSVIQPTAQIRTYSLTFPLCNRAFDRKLAQIIKGEGDFKCWSYDNYIYFRDDDPFTPEVPTQATVVHKCRYITGKLTRERGSFYICTLNLQEVV